MSKRPAVDAFEVDSAAVGQPRGAFALKAPAAECPDVADVRGKRGEQGRTDEVEVVAHHDELVRGSQPTDLAGRLRLVGGGADVPSEQLGGRGESMATGPRPTMTSFGTGTRTVVRRVGSTNVPLAPVANSRRASSGASSIDSEVYSAVSPRSVPSRAITRQTASRSMSRSQRSDGRSRAGASTHRALPVDGSPAIAASTSLIATSTSRALPGRGSARPAGCRVRRTAVSRPCRRRSERQRGAAVAGVDPLGVDDPRDADRRIRTQTGLHGPPDLVHVPEPRPRAEHEFLSIESAGGRTTHHGRIRLPRPR